LERAFLDDSNVKETAGYMHTIFAPSEVNKYVGTAFPNVANAIFEYEEASEANSTTSALDLALEKIKFNLSVLIYTIQSASSILRESFDFDRD
jgi:hypothetical protein